MVSVGLSDGDAVGNWDGLGLGLVVGIGVVGDALGDSVGASVDPVAAVGSLVGVVGLTEGACVGGTGMGASVAAVGDCDGLAVSASQHACRAPLACGQHASAPSGISKNVATQFVWASFLQSADHGTPVGDVVGRAVPHVSDTLTSFTASSVGSPSRGSPNALLAPFDGVDCTRSVVVTSPPSGTAEHLNVSVTVATSPAYSDPGCSVGETASHAGTLSGSTFHVTGESPLLMNRRCSMEWSSPLVPSWLTSGSSTPHSTSPHRVFGSVPPTVHMASLLTARGASAAGGQKNVSPRCIHAPPAVCAHAAASASSPVASPPTQPNSRSSS